MSYVTCETSIREDARIREQGTWAAAVPIALRVGEPDDRLQVAFINPTKPVIIGDDTGSWHCLNFTHGVWLSGWTDTGDLRAGDHRQQRVAALAVCPSCPVPPSATARSSERIRSYPDHPARSNGGWVSCRSDPSAPDFLPPERQRAVGLGGAIIDGVRSVRAYGGVTVTGAGAVPALQRPPEDVAPLWLRGTPASGGRAGPRRHRAGGKPRSQRNDHRVSEPGVYWLDLGAPQRSARALASLRSSCCSLVATG